MKKTSKLKNFIIKRDITIIDIGGITTLIVFVAILFIG